LGFRKFCHVFLFWQQFAVSQLSTLNNVGQMARLFKSSGPSLLNRDLSGWDFKLVKQSDRGSLNKVQ